LGTVWGVVCWGVWGIKKRVCHKIRSEPFGSLFLFTHPSGELPYYPYGPLFALTNLRFTDTLPQTAVEKLFGQNWGLLP